jgi:hypothetical protein
MSILNIEYRTPNPEFGNRKPETENLKWVAGGGWRKELMISDFRFPICGSATASIRERSATTACLLKRLRRLEFCKSAIGNRQSKLVHLPGGER